MRKSGMPLVVTSAYMLAGAGWIVMGYFFSRNLGDQATSLFELYKGLAFIAVTATVLFSALYYLHVPVAATGAPAALAAEFENALHKSERTRRWLPVMLGIALAVLLGLLLLALMWMRENNLREGEASADALRHAIAEHTGASLRIIDLTLSAIARDIAEGALPDPDIELRRRLPILDPLVRALWIVDSQGLMTHATGADISRMDLSGRSYFLHHQQQKNTGIFIDAPLHSLVRGTWFIGISRAVRSSSGEFLGVVVATLDPERFGHHWQMPASGNAISVSLFNHDGVLLMRSPHHADVIGKSFRDTHAWRELVPRQAAGTYRAASNIDGIRRIYAFGRIPDYPLEIFIGIPESQVLSGWYGFAAISLGSYLMAGGALVLLAFILMRQIHKRLLLQRRIAELAHYPLQNHDPVLTVGPDGRTLFRNAAADNLILGTRDTPAGKQLDDFLRDAALGKNRMLREFPIGERLFSASCTPRPPAHCDIYLTDITERRQQQHLLLRQKNIYAALSETNEAIVRLRQRDILFENICRIAVERAGFAFVWLELLDTATGTLRTVARCGDDRGYIDAVRNSADVRPASHGPAGAVLREGRCQIINDIAGSPTMQPWQEAAKHAGVQSSAIFPVTQANKVIGALNFYARDPGYFDPEIVELLDQMAADLSYALDHLAAGQQLRESESKFKGLVEQSLVGIYILDGETLLYANPRTAEIFGRTADEITGRSIRPLIDESDWPLVISGLRKRLSGETGNVRCEFHGRRRDGTPIMLGAHGNRAQLDGHPVILGVLQDITERHQVEEKIRGYVQQLERSILSTVDAISFMVDLRDPYTAGHERRVGDLAAKIGGELGLDAHDIMGLRIAGYVHDVGKIAVPAEILAKPGRLSPAEFDIVKTHAEKGYEILKNIEFPWPVADAVWQHHERLNGQGYPRGLSGEQIILEARILAVADVVESMATHRPYRPALGLEAALAEIETHAGTLFDTVVVAACLRLFREKQHRLSD